MTVSINNLRNLAEASLLHTVRCSADILSEMKGIKRRCSEPFHTITYSVKDWHIFMDGILWHWQINQNMFWSINYLCTVWEQGHLYEMHILESNYFKNAGFHFCDFLSVHSCLAATLSVFPSVFFFFFAPALCSLTATHPRGSSSDITFFNPPKLDQVYLLSYAEYVMYCITL